MSDSLDTLKGLAQQIRNATLQGENTAERVGRVLEGTVQAVEDMSVRNKGYFTDSSKLTSAYPSAQVGDQAYVGTSYPYAIWRWNGSAWEDTGGTGGDATLNLNDYSTKEETQQAIEDNIDQELDTESERGIANGVVTKGIANIEEKIGFNEYPTFSKNEAYQVGNVVNYNKKLYQFTSHHAPGDWIGTDVVNYNLSKRITEAIDKKNIAISKYEIILSGEWGAVNSYKRSDIFLYKGINYYIKIITYTGSSKNVNIAIQNDAVHNIPIYQDRYSIFTPSINGYLNVYTYPSESEEADLNIEVIGEDLFNLQHYNEINDGILNYNVAHIDFKGGSERQAMNTGFYVNQGETIYIRKITDNDTTLLVYIQNNSINNQQVTKDFKGFVAQASGFLMVQINSSVLYEGELICFRKKSRLDSIDIGYKLVVNENLGSDTHYWPFKPIRGKAYFINVPSGACNFHLYDKDKVKIADIGVVGGSRKECFFIYNEHVPEVEFIGGYFSSTNQDFSVECKSILANSEKDIPIYLSPDGDDGNLGTKSFPVKTLNKALQLSNKVIIMDGLYYNQYLDCSGKFGNIELIADDSCNPIFMLGNIVATDNGTLHSEGIYKIQVSSDPNCKLLFQFNKGDTETFIDKDKRHYLQGQRTYRNDCTSIYRVDSLLELENHAFSYYYSSNETCIYVKGLSSISEDNFLFAPSGVSMFNNIEDVNLYVKGINVYGGDGLFTTNGKFVAENCSIKYAEIGWSNHNSKGAVLYHCEAAGIIAQLKNVYGDGFSTSLDSNNEDTNINFPIVSMTMVDCYSHDNWNDGFSSHYNSSVKIYGGVFEYNCIGGHGAGLTPSFGAHDAIYNAITQYNSNLGFFYTADGDQAIGAGKYGICQLFGVISRNNKSDGFKVATENDVVELKDCISYDNGGYGYSAAENSVMRLLNCYANNNTSGSKDKNVNVVECLVVS